MGVTTTGVPNMTGSPPAATTSTELLQPTVTGTAGSEQLTPSPSYTPQAQKEIGSPIEANSFSIHMQDETTGWALVQVEKDTPANRILHSSGGGETWLDTTPVELPGGINRAFFLDGVHAWGIQQEIDGAVVWITSDGGESWTRSKPLEIFETSSTSITFVDEENGWLFAGEPAGMHKVPTTVYRTNDGGSNWQISYADQPGETGELFSGYKSDFVFWDANSGLAGVSSPYVLPEIVITSDGGITWEHRFLPAPDPYAEDEIGDCDVSGSPQGFPDGAVILVYNCWIDNQLHRYLYRSTDGGETWSSNRIPGLEGEVEFGNSQSGWATNSAEPGAGKSELFRSRDGGLTWALSDGEFFPVIQLDFVSDQHGWGVMLSDGSVILVRTGDSGATWTELKPLILD